MVNLIELNQITEYFRYVKVGDEVAQFDNICEVQSDKAAVTITSRFDGIVKKLNHDVGTIVKVGSALLEIETSSATDEESPNKIETPKEQPTENSEGKSSTGFTLGKTLATPAVRRIAMENKV